MRIYVCVCVCSYVQLELLKQMVHTAIKCFFVPSNLWLHLNWQPKIWIQRRPYVSSIHIKFYENFPKMYRPQFYFLPLPLPLSLSLCIYMCVCFIATNNLLFCIYGIFLVNINISNGFIGIYIFIYGLRDLQTEHSLYMHARTCMYVCTNSNQLYALLE